MTKHAHVTFGSQPEGTPAVQFGSQPEGTKNPAVQFGSVPAPDPVQHEDDAHEEPRAARPRKTRAARRNDDD